MTRVWVLGAALALAACAVTRPPDSPTVLRVSPVFPPVAGRPAAGSVAVAPVQARGLAGERRYVYVERAAPAELHQAASLFWEESPATILQAALVRGLRAHFASVVGPEAALAADRRVIVRLDRFEEENGGGAAARAVVAFEVTVTASSPPRVAFGGSYCAAAPIAGGAPSARAQAFEVALAAAVTAFVADLATGARSTTSCQE